MFVMANTKTISRNCRYQPSVRTVSRGRISESLLTSLLLALVHAGRTSARCLVLRSWSETGVFLFSSLICHSESLKLSVTDTDRTSALTEAISASSILCSYYNT